MLIVVVLAGALFGVGWSRLTIDTDIVSSLPHNDAVIENALHIFRNHPMQDQLSIDVGIDINDPDRLVACGQAVAAELEASGLFAKVGLAEFQEQLPPLMNYLVDNLPVLFTREELHNRVAPLLTSENIDRIIADWQHELFRWSGIGQAAFISRDPLGLKNLLLAKLNHLAPSQQARIYKGQLLSLDGRHLLVTATPVASSTDTVFARRLAGIWTKLPPA